LPALTEMLAAHVSVRLEPAGGEDDRRRAQLPGVDPNTDDGAVLDDQVSDRDAVPHLDTGRLRGVLVLLDEPLAASRAADREAAPEHLLAVVVHVGLPLVHQPEPQPVTVQPAHRVCAVGHQRLGEGRVVVTVGHPLHVRAVVRDRVRGQDGDRQPLVVVEDVADVFETFVGDPHGAGSVERIAAVLASLSLLQQQDPAAPLRCC
jgi:hypothetical protein